MIRPAVHLARSTLRQQALPSARRGYASAAGSSASSNLPLILGLGGVGGLGAWYYLGGFDSTAKAKANAQHLADQARDKAHDAKDKVHDAAHDAKEKAKGLAGDAKDKAQGLADDAKDKAARAAGDAKDKAAQAAGAASAAADSLGGALDKNSFKEFTVKEIKPYNHDSSL